MSAPAEKLLDVRGLSVAFGGIEAVRDVSFDVAAGELVTLIGANGAGKTTTLKAITRTLPASRCGGAIRFDGAPVDGLPSHLLPSRGLAMVPEGRGVFTRMTIRENLLMGAYARNDAGGIEADIDRWFTTFPRLKERHAQLAGTLSGGEQQMLAMARALMSRPRLLLLDEPSLGLAPLVVRQIFQTLRELAAGGMTIFLVEQNANHALRLSDRGYVLVNGEIRLTGTGAELLGNPEVRSAYLGGH